MKLELLSSPELVEEIKEKFPDVKTENGPTLGHWLETATLIIGSVAGILSIIDFIKKHMKSNDSENVRIVIETRVYDLRSEKDEKDLQKVLTEESEEKQRTDTE